MKKSEALIASDLTHPSDSAASVGAPAAASASVATAAPVGTASGNTAPDAAAVEYEKRLKSRMAMGLTREQATAAVKQQDEFDKHHAPNRAAFAAQGRAQHFGFRKSKPVHSILPAGSGGPAPL